LNQIDPHLYLRQVLECIASHPINRIEELLPWRLAPLLPLALSRAA
jgi:transposase